MCFAVFHASLHGKSLDSLQEKVHVGDRIIEVNGIAKAAWTGVEGGGAPHATTDIDRSIRTGQDTKAQWDAFRKSQT